MQKSSPLLLNLGQDLSIMIGLPKIASWKTAERPKKPKRGTFGFNVQTNNLEYFDGTDWFAAAMSEK
ncbi:hypothetical protein HYT32_01935 [Candidatus Roizmanbacteria bacterium]|nr:hypothetical protein [Candidatus Roizmanbacteria bacterium]